MLHMTDSQKFEAFGRAIVELKEAKFQLAAAQKRLASYLDVLRDVATSIESFASEPLRKAPDGRPLADFSYTWNSELKSQDLPALMHDVFTLATRVHKLQAEVDAFEK
jgi:hypothetical protein